MATPTPSTPVSSGVRNRFLLAGGVSLLAWLLLTVVAPGPSVPWTPEMTRASRAMAAALDTVARHCRSLGIPPPPGLDPNGTCLVGPELSPLVTSLGHLEAKRTTLTPDVAALLAHLLAEAGVGPGDAVAVGASGSFPGLMLATLVAVESLEARPRALLSLGASSYGATRPTFHLLDLYRLLESAGFVSAPPLAVSLGGSEDVGRRMEEGFRQTLLEELRGEPVPLLQDPDLPSNVERRLALYGSVEAFVNVGGAEANMGVSPKILALPPGRVEEEVDLPPREEQGVLFGMLHRGVPVIHLLNVRGLALRFGLPWDPLPLPDPGSTRLGDARHGRGPLFWLLTVLYLAALAGVAFGGRPGAPGKGEKR